MFLSLFAHECCTSFNKQRQQNDLNCKQFTHRNTYMLSILHICRVNRAEFTARNYDCSDEQRKNTVITTWSAKGCGYPMKTLRQPWERFAWSGKLLEAAEEDLISTAPRNTHTQKVVLIRCETTT